MVDRRGEATDHLVAGRRRATLAGVCATSPWAPRNKFPHGPPGGWTSLQVEQRVVSVGAAQLSVVAAARLLPVGDRTQAVRVEDRDLRTCPSDQSVTFEPRAPRVDGSVPNLTTWCGRRRSPEGSQFQKSISGIPAFPSDSFSSAEW